MTETSFTVCFYAHIYQTIPNTFISCSNATCTPPISIVTDILPRMNLGSASLGTICGGKLVGKSFIAAQDAVDNCVIVLGYIKVKSNDQCSSKVNYSISLTCYFCLLIIYTVYTHNCDFFYFFCEMIKQ